MKETNIVFELNFIFIVKNIFLNKEFYYVKKNLLLNFLPIIFLKKYKKIDWKLIGLEKNNEKILTQIIENDDVGKFVYNFLDYSNFIEIENNLYCLNTLEIKNIHKKIIRSIFNCVSNKLAVALIDKRLNSNSFKFDLLLSV